MFTSSCTGLRFVLLFLHSSNHGFESCFFVDCSCENQEATYRAEKLSPLPLRATWVGLLFKSYKPLKCRLNSFREHADSLVQKMIWGCVENFKMHSRLHPLLMHWTGSLSLSAFKQTKCLNILWLFFCFFQFLFFVCVCFLLLLADVKNGCNYHCILMGMLVRVGPHCISAILQKTIIIFLIMKLICRKMKL